ncbi:2-iminobutanoate/2-iminopropanoate deaminase [Hydrogenivirga caldilitoris]|uniref:2-iminobutanoate/2-iminopropanoate deaminase n=1 Tax=Hydrogenivirga caldilitoris TaxID=246264 RepID=A0A497XWI5_9AQUI|nr:Rid family detoxifying hydrolase [Hydrogenivirga caldilitoris]RLJ71123.1 2-iminobutanoate/2-iminopropanoate deaminase [Hydrogenivirga caldilitoris]
MKRAIFTEGAPAPVGPYSQAIEVNGTLYVSGQIGIDPGTNRLRESFEGQAEQVLKNVEAVLQEAGYSKGDIVKVVIYLTDITKFKEFNSLYESFFQGIEPKPARVTVGVKELPLGAQIEVEVTAVKV